MLTVAVSGRHPKQVIHLVGSVAYHIFTIWRCGTWISNSHSVCRNYVHHVCMIIVVCASVCGWRRRHCRQRRCRYTATSRRFSDTKWTVRGADSLSNTWEVLDASAELLSRRRSSVKLRRRSHLVVRRHCGASATGTRLTGKTDLHLTKRHRSTTERYRANSVVWPDAVLGCNRPTWTGTVSVGIKGGFLVIGVQLHCYCVCHGVHNYF